MSIEPEMAYIIDGQAIPAKDLAWCAFEPCGCCTGVTAASYAPSADAARQELADLNELPASTDLRLYELRPIADVRSGAIPLAWGHSERGCQKARADA